MDRHDRQAVLDAATDVKIVHLRRYAGYFDYFTVGGFKRDHPTTQTAPLSRGGMTVAQVRVDGKDFLGIAECSELDNYSKAIGREMALGRAIKAALQAWT